MDGRRQATEYLLAQQGIGLYSLESLELAVRGRWAAGLVVDDYELAIHEVQPVYDSPDAHAIDLRVELQLDAYGSDGGRVLHGEVALDKAGRVIEEGAGSSSIEVELLVVGVFLHDLAGFG